EAAVTLQSPAPATAARYHAAALRLMSAGAAGRTRAQLRLSDAQAAAGDAAGARDTLSDALRTAAPEDRLALTVGVANAEWWLGRTADARRRLQVALSALPASPTPATRPPTPRPTRARSAIPCSRLRRWPAARSQAPPPARGRRRSTRPP